MEGTRARGASLLCRESRLTDGPRRLRFTEMARTHGVRINDRAGQGQQTPRGERHQRRRRSNSCLEHSSVSFVPRPLQSHAPKKNAGTMPASFVSAFADSGIRIPALRAEASAGNHDGRTLCARCLSRKRFSALLAKSRISHVDDSTAGTGTSCRCGSRGITWFGGISAMTVMVSMALPSPTVVPAKKSFEPAHSFLQ